MPNLQTNIFETLDDLLFEVYQDLMDLESNVMTTRSAECGRTSEIIGACFALTNPRARLSRSEIKGKAFSPIGELLWYLAGSDKLDFIENYIPQYKKESDDNVTIYGAYGPRLFGRGEYKIDQISNVTKLLSGSRATSRRAVVQLFDASDIVDEHKDIPCTCTLQFLVREGKLNLYVSMRSNDAYKGLSHDIFAFTMLQEIVAVSLNLDLGCYYHSVGSLHLYEQDRKDIEQYFNEGYQPTKFNMPPMPKGDPWPSIDEVLKIEEKIRTHQEVDYSHLDDYWLDLVKLVQIHFLSKDKDVSGIKQTMAGMNEIYKMYIEKKIR